MISTSKIKTATGESNSDVLRALRSQVLGQWEALAGGRWARVEGHVEVIEPLHERIHTIYLELGPVTALTTVKERHGIDATGWDDLAAADLADYRLDGDGRRLIRRAGFFATEIEVTYTGGYEDDGSPGDIVEALLLQARFLRERNSGGKIVMASQSVGDAMTTYLKADYHPAFREAAQRHRRLT